MDIYKIAECTEKLLRNAGVPFDEEKALKLVYQWAKTGHTDFKEFQALIRLIQTKLA